MTILQFPQPKRQEPNEPWAPKLSISEQGLDALKGFVAAYPPRVAARRMERMLRTAYPQFDVRVRKAEATNKAGEIGFIVSVNGKDDQGLVFRSPKDDGTFYGLG